MTNIQAIELTKRAYEAMISLFNELGSRYMDKTFENNLEFYITKQEELFSEIFFMTGQQLETYTAQLLTRLSTLQVPYNDILNETDLSQLSSHEPLFYSFNNGEIKVAAESQIPFQYSPANEGSVEVRSFDKIETYDRFAMNYTFQLPENDQNALIFKIDAANDAYPLIQALKLSQENRDSEIDWKKVGFLVGQSSEGAQLFGKASMGTVINPGPWLPPGGQPIPFYIGNEAHRYIAAEYRKAHPVDVVRTNTTPISTILDVLKRRFKLDALPDNLDPSELILKPDILNLSKQHLFEIKPEKTGAAAAGAQAGLYIAAFKKAGIVISMGPMGEPGTNGVIPAPAGHFRYYTPAPGIILYQYKKGKFDPKTQPVTVPEKQPERKWYEWEYWEEVTGLTGAALLIYLIISEGSRLYPPRNLVPVP